LGILSLGNRAVTFSSYNKVELNQKELLAALLWGFL